MGDKLKKRRQRRQERAQIRAANKGQAPQRQSVNAQAERAEKPTDQRAAFGHWVRGSSGQFQDLACDMVGWLLVSEQITSAEEQAARTWQSLRVRYASELGIKLPRSCLLDVVSGYDEGDGDPETIRRYQALEKAIGPGGMKEVMRVCQDGTPPTNLRRFRGALAVVEKF